MRVDGGGDGGVAMLGSGFVNWIMEENGQYGLQQPPRCFFYHPFRGQRLEIKKRRCRKIDLILSLVVEPLT